MEIKKFELDNGVYIPSVCYGPGIIYPFRANVKRILTDAGAVFADIKTISTLDKGLKIGVNLIDTSESYLASEEVIGKKINKLSRNNYFITSKVSNRSQLQGTVQLSFENTLKKLNLEYIDLYLLHWPVTECFLDSWKVLENLYEQGLCKAIGVANCNIHHLEAISGIANVKPLVNQIECHPLFTNERLGQYCENENIRVMAYTPTGRMDKRLWITCLTEIAQKHNKSIAQVILRWHIQNGRIPVVNTNKIKHLKENMDIFDFILSDEEIELINDININSRLRYDPDNCDFSKL